MKKLTTLLLLSGLFIFTSAATFDKPAYQLYSNGKVVKYSELIDKAKNSDVVLFGELHNNPIAHWLELEVTKEIFSIKKGNIILGAEMFQSDNQLIIDEYLTSLIKEEHLIEEANTWKNYKTDYKPLMDFAKTNHLRFIGTNVPNRYASMVSRNGLNSLNNLTDISKGSIAPLPVNVDFELSSYKNMEQMFGSGHGSGMNVKYIIEAQALKDATMAYFINKNMKKSATFIHFNGSYHSDNFQGILWYLKKQNPSIKVLTISSIEKDNISQIDDQDKKLADFVIAIPESMTKTYQ